MRTCWPASAARLSDAELDEAESLDAGDPQELGALHRELSALQPNLAVLWEGLQRL